MKKSVLFFNGVAVLIRNRDYYRPSTLSLFQHSIVPNAPSILLHQSSPEISGRKIVRLYHTQAILPSKVLKQYTLENLRFKMEPVDDDNDKNDETNKPTQLSVQELRLRRLAAFGILQPQNITKEAKESSLQVRVSSKKNSIIDLMDDSSSDGETDAMQRSDNTKKRKPVRNPSIDNNINKIISIDDSENDQSDPGWTTYSRSKRKGNRKELYSEKNDIGSTQLFLWPLKNDSQETEINDDNNINVRNGESVWNFSVATWNVWFGREGDGNPHPAPRMRAIVRLLREQQKIDSPLYFIGFQEVIDPLANFLIPALESAGYHVYRQPDATYGCAVAVDKRLDIVSHSWNPYSKTIMDRGFYQVRAKLPSKGIRPEVVFTTTHLESFTGPQYTGATERVPQFREVEAFCNRQVTTATNPAAMTIMTGDMNWDDERTRSGSIDPVMSTVLKAPDQWHDSWLSSNQNSKAVGYTYDSKVNPMLGGNLRRRFDRCLVRGPGSESKTTAKNKMDHFWSVQSVSTTLLGQKALPDLVWQKFNPYNRSYKETPTAPSDHFGLVVDLQLSKTKQT